MMKKLFAMLMVLCICSAASASVVSLVGGGGGIVAPVGDVWIFVQTDTILLGVDAILTVTGGDIINAAMSPSDSGSYGWDPANFPIPPIGVGTAVVEIGGGSFTGAPVGNVGYVVVAYTGGTQVVSLAGGTAHGGSMDIGFGVPSFSTGAVTITPEPMTIALLGLGGLVLLRRRK
jgi:hypothetical protein